MTAHQLAFELTETVRPASRPALTASVSAPVNHVAAPDLAPVPLGVPVRAAGRPVRPIDARTAELGRSGIAAARAAMASASDPRETFRTQRWDRSPAALAA